MQAPFCWGQETHKEPTFWAFSLFAFTFQRATLIAENEALTIVLLLEQFNGSLLLFVSTKGRNRRVI